MAMLTCGHAKTMLAGYADGALSATEREAVEIHLERCGRCRQLVLDQQRVQRVLGSYGPPRTSEEDWEAVGERLRAELEGTGLRAVLKTRPRIEALAEKPPRETEPETPTSAPVPTTPAATEKAAGSQAAVRLRPLRPEAVRGGRSFGGARRRPRFGWVAHVIGLLAAAAAVALGLLMASR